MSTFVFGHINPDTDATCSAIAAAWYLNELGITDAIPFCTGNLNKETQFVLDHFKVETPELITELSPGQPYFVVDTNNPEELIPSFVQGELTGIIDHHKFAGGLSTPGPISVRIEPLACTATVLTGMLRAAELTPPREITGIMLACIISDTLNFVSPTSTEIDKRAAHYLAELTGESIDELADAMFSAKSDLSGLTLTDLLTLDSKVYNLGKAKVRVSVLETTKPSNVLDQVSGVIEAMQALSLTDGTEGCFFFVVDILKDCSTLITSTSFEQEVAAKAFSVEPTQTILLPGVVSRKKQMIPKLETALS